MQLGIVLIALSTVLALGDRPTLVEGATDGTAARGAVTGLKDDLLKDWTSQRETLLKIVGAMPEEKFGFRPTPAQRTFGEQVAHIATTNVSLLRTLGGQTAPPVLGTATTKAALLDILATSYDFGAALLREWSDADMVEIVQGPRFLGPSTRARIIYTLLAHGMDTYGQIVVYLRLNGLVPPASAGV